MALNLCFSLIEQKGEFEKFKALVEKISETQWKQISNNSTLLWPLFDKHEWTWKEYETWSKKDGWDLNSSLFPYEIESQDTIVQFFSTFPSGIKVILYNDLLIIQDEFIPPFHSFQLLNYSHYGVDRKELLALRIDSFLTQKRTIKDVRNFVLAQILYLGDPSFYHNLFNANEMNQIESELKSHQWLLGE